VNWFVLNGATGSPNDPEHEALWTVHHSLPSAERLS
jgi:hypothetical protein